jgi:hypothetical protein
LTNFSNGKQTQESLKSGFPETTFRETNMALVVLVLKRKEKGSKFTPDNQTRTSHVFSAPI